MTIYQKIKRNFLKEKFLVSDFPRVCISCWSLKSIRHCRSRSRRGIFEHFVIAAAFFNTQIVLGQNGFGSVLLTVCDWFIDIGFKKLYT